LMVASGGDRLVLVDEPPQPIATDDPLGTDRSLSSLPPGHRRAPLERAVRPGPVVGRDVLPHHRPELEPPDNQHPIQAFAPYRRSRERIPVAATRWPSLSNSPRIRW